MLRNLLSTGALLALLAGTAVAQDAKPATDKLATATFASGCFWCTEKDFEEVEGVVEAVSGFTGGIAPNPTYKQVTYGTTGHVEAVQVRYDPTIVSYDELLDVYWRNVDFLDPDGQFCDRGASYATAIFWHDEAQRDAAEADKEEIASSGVFEKPVVTRIEQESVFYPAEDYHQDYYKKNPIQYKFYRWNCGRDARLEELREGLAKINSAS